CPGCPAIPLVPLETRLTAPVVELPFMRVGGLPLLEVRINGQGPFRVLLDTGAEAAAFLPPRGVRRLGLPVACGSRILGATAEPVEAGVRVRRVETAEIGGVEFRDFRAVEVPTLEHQFPGLDGALGMGLFWDCLLTVDYPAGRVRITRGVLPAPDGREYLPLAAGTMQPVTILAIGSVQMPVLIDSGSSSGLSVTPDVERGLAFSHPPVGWF